jgi:serine/threonine-protein kinase RsbW
MSAGASQPDDSTGLGVPLAASGSFRLPSRIEEVEQARRALVQAAGAAGFAEEDLLDITLAVEEALINAMRHGNRLDPARQVRVEYQIAPEEFRIVVEDEGSGFDPAAVPDPRGSSERNRTSGRGIALLRAVMSEVAYNSRGNGVTLVKRPNAARPAR